jgi:uroporphyrinogen-III synthase
MAYNDGAGPPPTLLLTRPRETAKRFALEAASRWPQARVAIAPLMEIVPVGAQPSLDGVDSVIFTSVNGVARAGPGGGRHAWCVGARTAEAAARAGFAADLAVETADDLVAALTALAPGGRIVHLHGRHRRGDVAGRLAAAGLNVAGIAVYDQRAAAPDSVFFDALAAERLIVPLFSPRSADLFARAAAPVLGDDPRAGMRLVALSAAVRAALPGTWRAATDIAARPEAGAMLDAVARRIYP